jgi:hypothetical protein
MAAFATGTGPAPPEPIRTLEQTRRTELWRSLCRTRRLTRSHEFISQWPTSLQITSGAGCQGNTRTISLYLYQIFAVSPLIPPIRRLNSGIAEGVGRDALHDTYPVNAGWGKTGLPRPFDLSPQSRSTRSRLHHAPPWEPIDSMMQSSNAFF